MKQPSGYTVFLHKVRRNLCQTEPSSGRNFQSMNVTLQSLWEGPSKEKEDGRAFSSSYEIVEFLIGILGSASNTLVLLAIYKDRCLRTITNCFVGSLALSDVLVGLVVPPIAIMSQEGLPRNFTLCVMLSSLEILFANISVLNLLSVALERFLAIRNPFLYNRWLTIQRALLLVAVTWIVAILVGLIPVMGWNAGEEGFEACHFDAVISFEYMVYLIFLVFTLPPLIAMCAIYFYIFTVVRKTKKAIMLLVAPEGKDKIKKSLKATKRGDRGILLVIVLFILCWMPFHIMNILQLVLHPPLPHKYHQVGTALSHLNSALNPFLFAFGSKRFKWTIKRLLFGRCIHFKEEENTAIYAEKGQQMDKTACVRTMFLLGHSISLLSHSSAGKTTELSIAEEIMSSLQDNHTVRSQTADPSLSQECQDSASTVQESYIHFPSTFRGLLETTSDTSVLSTHSEVSLRKIFLYIHGSPGTSKDAEPTSVGCPAVCETPPTVSKSFDEKDDRKEFGERQPPIWFRSSSVLSSSTDVRPSMASPTCSIWNQRYGLFT